MRFRKKANFEAFLKKTCPNTFQLLNKPLLDNHGVRPAMGEPIQFGLEVSRGWWDIVLQCGISLEELNSTIPSIGFNAVQVKEKFGALEIYIDFGNNCEVVKQVYDIVATAREKANSVCEICGQPGKLRTFSGWMRVKCLDCSKITVELNES